VEQLSEEVDSLKETLCKAFFATTQFLFLNYSLENILLVRTNSFPFLSNKTVQFYYEKNAFLMQVGV
jgi:hypothetical protein